LFAVVAESFFDFDLFSIWVVEVDPVVPSFELSTGVEKLKSNSMSKHDSSKAITGYFFVKACFDNQQSKTI